MRTKDLYQVWLFRSRMASGNPTPGQGPDMDNNPDAVPLGPAGPGGAPVAGAGQAQTGLRKNTTSFKITNILPPQNKDSSEMPGLAIHHPNPVNHDHDNENDDESAEEDTEDAFDPDDTGKIECDTSSYRLDFTVISFLS